MLNSLFDLTGRVALITGGSKGLGKAIARGFAEAGANVVIAARSGDELNAAAAEIGEGLSVEVAAKTVDMSDRQSVAELAKWSLDRFGRVDILINNAGSNQPQALTDTTDESWDYILELNFTSCMQLARA
ncbi:MAG: SDR family NAD(P)-dependent oxidoreductase, partial [Planctomycetales bacterium]|nr:SDR family NAD(P)-dependent oxidoreductase [Planctomycetales bacterium]